MPAPFMFFDLRTTDAAASRAFYGDLFGWTTTDGPVPMFTDGAAPWGGLTELTPDDARTPQWVPYVAVDDLTTATARARDLGATIIRERVEIPQGAMAVLTDPTGATLVLWQDA